MFDFLKSAIGKAKQAGMPTTEAEDVTTREIAVDLKRLEAISPELAQRTIVYVLTGEGSSVLLQLEQQANAVQTALSRYQNVAMPTATQAEMQTRSRPATMFLCANMDPKRRGYVAISRSSPCIKRGPAGAYLPIRDRALCGFGAFSPRQSSLSKTGRNGQPILTRP